MLSERDSKLSEQVIISFEQGSKLCKQDIQTSARDILTRRNNLIILCRFSGSPISFDTISLIGQTRNGSKQGLLNTPANLSVT